MLDSGKGWLQQGRNKPPGGEGEVFHATKVSTSWNLRRGKSGILSFSDSFGVFLLQVYISDIFAARKCKLFVQSLCWRIPAVTSQSAALIRKYRARRLFAHVLARLDHYKHGDMSSGGSGSKCRRERRSSRD